MEAIVKKLKSLNKTLRNLKGVTYKDGNDPYLNIYQLVERIIDRVYPEKDAKILKSEMCHYCDFGYEISESEKQKEYEEKIDFVIRVISTILEESELFGFDDFKPIKEEVETEVQAGIPNLFSLRRKTKK
jgi:hypothetical protein